MHSATPANDRVRRRHWLALPLLLCLVPATARAQSSQPQGAASDDAQACLSGATAIIADPELTTTDDLTDACRRFVATPPADAETNYRAGMVFDRAGHLADAEAAFERAVASDHAGAMVALARMRRDDAKAATTLNERAAARGNAEATLALAEDHLHGRGRPRDVVKARALLEAAAAKGDAGAMVRLGWIHANGFGVARGREAAVEWFRRAAATGDRAAGRLLAEQYLPGRLAPANADAAIAEFDRLARAGDLTAVRRLADLLEGGVDVAPDPVRLIALRRKLARLGEEVGPNHAAFDDRRRYAQMLWNGEGAKPDRDQAVRLWPRPAEARGAEDWLRLIASTATDDLVEAARALLDGDELPLDVDAAVERLRVAADRGDARALTLLADQMVVSTPAAELPAAIALYERAAAAGSPQARHRLATFLWRGMGVAKDPPRAIALTRAAAETGNRGALADLYRLTADGRGVPKDVKAAARHWVRLLKMRGELPKGTSYEEAARRLVQGLAEEAPDLRRAALAELRQAPLAPQQPRRGRLLEGDLVGAAFADLARDGKAVSRDERLAWLELASDAGDPEAGFELSRMHALGDGAPKDLAKALARLIAASKAGHSGASVRLVEFYDEQTGSPQSPALAADHALQALRSRYLELSELTGPVGKARPEVQAEIRKRLAALGHASPSADWPGLLAAMTSYRAKAEKAHREAEQ